MGVGVTLGRRCRGSVARDEGQSQEDPDGGEGVVPQKERRRVPLTNRHQNTSFLIHYPLLEYNDP